MNRKNGFTLIELLIVVGVLMVLAALAIPNLMRSRIQAAETSTVASLRTITTAQISYMTTYQGFPANLAQLGPGNPASSVAADLIDSTLASGMRSGYAFIYLAADADGDGRNEQFTVRANPVQPGVTGIRYFYVDQTNVIRFNMSAPAGPGDTPIPN